MDLIGFLIILLIFAFAFGFIGSNKGSSIKNYRIISVRDHLFEIVGEQSYQTNLAKIAGAKTSESKAMDCAATVQCEPSNPYDSNAVVVKINDLTVGYLSRSDAVEFRKALSSARLPLNQAYFTEAIIDGGWRDGMSEGSYGVKLKLPSKVKNWGIRDA